MEVRKKSGEIEQFDVNKLVESIVRASDNSHEPLNMGDIDVLTKDIIHRLSEEGNVVPSEHVFDTTLLYLVKDRFYHVAKEYREENQW